MDRRQKQQRLKKELTGLLLRNLAVQLLVYMVIVMCCMFLAYWLCSRRVWYWNDPFYSVVHFLHENLISFFLTCLLLGFFVITIIFIRRIVRYMGYIIDSVNDIYRDTDNQELIELPQELYEVGRQLNQIQMDVRTSRQKAKEAEQRKNDLIVYMAHDLKTPLTSVIGYLSLLQEETDITPQLRNKYQNIALKKAERLEELINEFFEITRFNLSQMTLELSSVNMTTMIQQIVYEFRPMFAEKGLTYELDLEKDLMVTCDVDKMERVFDNLLKNAVNYSYENTQIYIYAKRHGTEGVAVTFVNHGKTIPKEKLGRLFEQFFRMESARSSKSGGAGLGLAIAKEIVQLHGGELTCESENETITFRMVIDTSRNV